MTELGNSKSRKLGDADKASSNAFVRDLPFFQVRVLHKALSIHGSSRNDSSSYTSFVQPTSQHFSVGPDGRKVYDLHFASEALGMPASMGYGWANLDFGQKIGPDGRYTIERKLGWGMHSSTWLSRDNSDCSFVAIKVCTAHMTENDRKNLLWESDALRAVSIKPTSPHSIRLLSDFTFSDESGDHLCFVTPFVGFRCLSQSVSFYTCFVDCDMFTLEVLSTPASDWTMFSSISKSIRQALSNAHPTSRTLGNILDREVEQYSTVTYIRTD
ncbi:serine threonine-protein kinase srpk2 [Moniliophthora roreri MCA 2997]|uniref:non-specific serine/threonine protein kinase n=1 Tax=Moniliophthora roreri (strain MCA 2997) TaxID=1381753 RepID=V2WG35_MONRO|nr:serine threonine-protein kinase srpk2 [Moniliophthora roreri MCA 2997]